MKPLDIALRVSAVLALASVTAAGVAVTWSQSVRVAPVSTIGLAGVYRENVWTGAKEICGAAPNNRGCFSLDPAKGFDPSRPFTVETPSPRFDGTPVAP